jgi:hypothetical protein
MPYRNIHVRSPFYVQWTSSEPIVYLEIRIWSGDVVSDKPAAATYVMQKEQTDGKATFEIAELIRDYCKQTSLQNTGFVWVETRINDLIAVNTATYLASEGYTLYTDGVQHNGNSFLTDFVALPTTRMQTKEHRVLTTRALPSYFNVYVQPQNTADWSYRYKVRDTQSYTSSAPMLPQSESTTQFVTIYAAPNYDLCEITIDGVLHYVHIDEAVCNKYNTNPQITFGGTITKDNYPASLVYVNKYGAKAWFPFSVKHIESISVESNTFQRNVMNYAALNHGDGLHSSRRRLMASKQSFELNTDWIHEDYVPHLEELIMSEYVWLKMPNISNDLMAVNLKTESLEKKNHLNDKLIQYNIKVEAASEYINHVR